MRNLIWLIVLFAIAVVVAVGAKFYSGDVYILIEQTQIRLNLHLFIGLVLLTVVILYIVLRVFAGLLHVPSRWQRWYKNHQQQKVETALNQAGLAYFEGRYQQAQSQAQKVLNNKQAGKNRALALMMAMHSADQTNDIKARDQYLQEIAELPSKQQLTRYLFIAESALAKHHYDEAAKSLESAAAINPKLTRLVKLQLRYDFDQQKPLDALDKINQLNRAGALSQTELQDYYLWAYRLLLSKAQDSRQFKKSLHSIPSDVREQELSVDIANKYIQLGLYPQAMKWVKKTYPRQSNADLLPAFHHAFLYLDDKEQKKAMELAEGWLQQRPHDNGLLLLLGELAYDHQLWGKAQGYLEASLALSESIPARLMLAKVFEQSGHITQAEEQRKYVLSELRDDEEI